MTQIARKFLDAQNSARVFQALFIARLLPFWSMGLHVIVQMGCLICAAILSARK